MTHITSIQTPPERTDGNPFTGQLHIFWQNQLEFWVQTGLLAPVIRVKLGPRKLWVVSDPLLFEEIFQKKAKNFPRSDAILREDSIDPQQTVFNAPTWDEWLWRRRLLQPAFHRKQLAKFATTMVGETARLLDGWGDGARFDLKTAMKTLTMNVIGRTMFSAQLGEIERLADAFETIGEYSRYKTLSMFPLPPWVPMPLYRRAREAGATRREIVGRFVTERMASGQPQDDLLDMLIASSLDDGTVFSAETIVDEMLSIIFAGHETTAMTLVWVFVMLWQHPHEAQRIYAEVDGVLQGRQPTLADLDSMPLTHQFILETMRLYPSVYGTLRQAIEDDHLGGYDVPASTELMINIRAVQRHPDYWNAPLDFRLDRFSAENTQNRPKLAFAPFISGPRKCIGDSFAMMEMRLVVPTILQRFRVRVDGDLPTEIPGFTMEPRGAVEVTARLRR